MFVCLAENNDASNGMFVRACVRSGKKKILVNRVKQDYKYETDVIK